MQLFFTLTLIILLAYGVLINYYFWCWLSIPDLTEISRYNLAVTVIVPARNEEKNIHNCLQALTRQTHAVQVIVVNDHSSDRTASIVADFPAQNILLINLSDYVSGEINSYKKKAIELAITHATGELIVCTDADCVAAENWIATLVHVYQMQKASFIAAPVKMKNDGSLLGIFQSLDFLPLQGITAASVFKGIHAMSNGANLAYSKSSFAEVDGFKDINRIASGDDMLLMQKIAAKFSGRIFYAKSKAAIVSTMAEPTLPLFFNQRIRWASKAGHYKQPTVSAALLLVYLANLLLLVLLPIYWKGFLMLLVLKILMEFPFVFSVSKFYDQQKLMIFFPFIQPLHIFYTVIAGALGMFGTYRWKSRRVR